MVLVEPVATAAKAGIAEEKASVLPEPLQLPDISMNYTPLRETGTV